MVGHWSEKLFRMKMGYMELTGDEFPVYPYYKEANTEYRNLTKIEQRLFDARQNGTISEKKAAQIALAQIQVNAISFFQIFLKKRVAETESIIL